MAEFGPRKDAEIRRMSSQKVAAELLKTLPGAQPDWDLFLEVVNLVDDDVVAAGDRAIAKLQTSEAQVTEFNGKIDPIDEKLDDRQQAKMLQFLDDNVNEIGTADYPDKVPSEAFKLELWTAGLPQVAHKELVKVLTVEQGNALYGRIVEALKSVGATPNDAA